MDLTVAIIAQPCEVCQCLPAKPGVVFVVDLQLFSRPAGLAALAIGLPIELTNHFPAGRLDVGVIISTKVVAHIGATTPLPTLTYLQLVVLAAENYSTIQDFLIGYLACLHLHDERFHVQTTRG